jgi:hypothetical protein
MKAMGWAWLMALIVAIGIVSITGFASRRQENARPAFATQPQAAQTQPEQTQ